MSARAVITGRPPRCGSTVTTDGLGKRGEEGLHERRTVTTLGVPVDFYSTERNVQIGEDWVYRAKQSGPVTRVRVLRIGSTRPKRVLVRFVDEEFEGREEWVPPTRLKTTWANVDEWRADDARWQAIRADTRRWGDPELEAAELVIEHVIPSAQAQAGFNRGSGLLFIKSVSDLALHLQVEAESLVDDPLAFSMKDGTWVVPFKSMLRIAQRATQVFAEEVFEKVQKDEEEAQRENIHGASNGGAYIPPEICAEVDEKYAPARQMVREWCGKEAAEHVTELAALREEVFRLGKLIERSISLLRSHDSAAAIALERELGLPIETLRNAKRRDS